jgi:hypothetical protein
MLSRGYAGAMPDPGRAAAPAAEWGGAALVVALAAGLAAIGWVVR